MGLVSFLEEVRGKEEGVIVIKGVKAMFRDHSDMAKGGGIME
jgi:hypothetical protein